jgi:hypothetical protein
MSPMPAEQGSGGFPAAVGGNSVPVIPGRTHLRSLGRRERSEPRRMNHGRCSSFEARKPAAQLRRRCEEDASAVRSRPAAMESSRAPFRNRSKPAARHSPATAGDGRCVRLSPQLRKKLTIVASRGPMTALAAHPIPVCSQINNYDREELWKERRIGCGRTPGSVAQIPQITSLELRKPRTRSGTIGGLQVGSDVSPRARRAPCAYPLM